MRGESECSNFQIITYVLSSQFRFKLDVLDTGLLENTVHQSTSVFYSTSTFQDALLIK